MRARQPFRMTSGISAALAVLLLVSGGRYAPLPRLGCDALPSVLSGALAVSAAIATPLRHVSKQRQRQPAATAHAAPGMAHGARPGLPHPLVLADAPPPGDETLPLLRHLRGMLPHSQAPPRLRNLTL